MKIIFFAPYNISETRQLPLDRAPRIRCHQIYKYLQEKCEVILIGGNSKERKGKCHKILTNGLLDEIDGFYMESANCSLKHFDISFLKKISKNKIPMSIFYRDIFWKFPVFAKTIYQKIKFQRKLNKSTKQFIFFKNIFNIIYSPTKEFAKFAELNPIHLLPPAGEIIKLKKESRIGILFAGSQKDGFENLLKANNILLQEGFNLPFYFITQNIKFNIPDNFIIYPEISEKIINKVHIGLIPLNPTNYYKLAIPLKFMQYLSYGLPVICQKLPALIKYDNQYHVCKFYDGTPEDLTEKIKYLIQNKQIRNIISENAMNAVIKKENWQQRINIILSDLQNSRKKR